MDRFFWYLVSYNVIKTSENLLWPRGGNGGASSLPLLFSGHEFRTFPLESVGVGKECRNGNFGDGNFVNDRSLWWVGRGGGTSAGSVASIESLKHIKCIKMFN